VAEDLEVGDLAPSQSLRHCHRKMPTLTFAMPRPRRAPRSRSMTFRAGRGDLRYSPPEPGAQDRASVRAGCVAAFGSRAAGFLHGELPSS
jgi:hypothetical protein